MDKVVVPAKEGRAVHVPAGERIRVTTPHGQQAADFFAYSTVDLNEWLSPMHTWVTTYCIKPRQGDILRSRFRRPMLEFVDDGAGGVHDMMIAACDKLRYEEFGHEGPHASCAENLMVSLRRLGHEISVVPQPVNFFTHTRIEPDGRLVSPPNPVPARRLRGAGGSDEPHLRRLLLPFRPRAGGLDDQRRRRSHGAAGRGRLT